MSDSKEKRVALRNDRPLFLADESYFRIGDARQGLPRAYSVESGDPWVEKDCDPKRALSFVHVRQFFPGTLAQGKKPREVPKKG
jgi:hypothetical protein